MLRLTRREAEVITVGGSVRVTVLSVRDSQVKLGIVAPLDVPVHREEIYRRMRAEAAGGVVCPAGATTEPETEG
jgi:carbon storage regulator